MEEIIHDVDASTTRFIKTKYGRELLLVIAATMLWVITLMAYWYFTLRFPDPRLWLLAVIPYAIFYKHVKSRVQSAFMRQFAKANGYIYQEKGRPELHTAYFFKVGHSRKVNDYVTGSYNGYPLALFNYAYTLGSGKSARSYYHTVFCLELPTLLPEVLLLVDKKLAGTSPPTSAAYENKIHLSLQGEFDKAFDLYVRKDFEIEALQVFNTAFMERLEGEWKGFNFEITGNRIYLYYHPYMSKKAELERMYALAQYLITSLAPVSERMHSGLKAMNEAYAPKKRVS